MNFSELRSYMVLDSANNNNPHADEFKFIILYKKQKQIFKFAYGIINKEGGYIRLFIPTYHENLGRHLWEDTPYHYLYSPSDIKTMYSIIRAIFSPRSLIN